MVFRRDFREFRNSGQNRLAVWPCMWMALYRYFQASLTLMYLGRPLFFTGFSPRSAIYQADLLKVRYRAYTRLGPQAAGN